MNTNVFKLSTNPATTLTDEEKALCRRGPDGFHRRVDAIASVVARNKGRVNRLEAKELVETWCDQNKVEL